MGTLQHSSTRSRKNSIQVSEKIAQYDIVAFNVNSISDDCLFVGIATKMRLRKLLDEGDISAAEATKFYAGARAFYVKAMEYALANLPLKDNLLRNAKFGSFKSRESARFSQVEYFIQR